MTFETNIKEWVMIDNQIKAKNEELKRLRTQKNDLNSNIISYANHNNLTKSVVNISDGRLKFINFNQAEPLTFKYIENTLNRIISDSNQVDFILNALKQNRIIKNSLEIKRFSNN
jgi:hypothetical protein